MTDGAKGWIDDELAGCRFVDRCLAAAPAARADGRRDGGSIPLVCGD